MPPPQTARHQRPRGDLTPMMVFAIFSAVLGMFQFGFNTGVINAPQKVLEEFIANVYKSQTGNYISEELRDVIWSITVSIFAIGGMVGGLMGSTVANWCGRKTGLVLNNTIAVVGVTLMSSSQLSYSIECLIVGRFFIGLNCGLNTALVPMYLTEISPVNIRGALGTVSQLGVTVGLLFSQVLGLKDILGTKELWPFLFGFAFVPAVLQLIMLPFCPESPRYLLLSCGRISDARLALRRLRGSSDVEGDIEEMRAEDRAHQEEVRKYGKLNSIKELFNHPWLRTPMIIGIVMQLSQQLSGINAIFYYSTDIFLSAELPESYAVFATMGVGAIMVIMTLISIPLMDRLGRRALHLYGLGGMFLASIFLTISLLLKFLYEWMKYISVISILIFTVFFGIGPGSIPFMITAELFTQGTRPTAMSVSVLFNWLSNFLVGLAFPLMKRMLQSYLFLPFTVFLAIFWIFLYKKLPETKNRTFEEISALFKPIQFGSAGGSGGGGGATGYTDYGCASLTNLELANQDNSPNSPNRNDGQHQKMVTTQDRFRFDSATTGSFVDQEQQRSGGASCSLHAASNQVCPDQCTQQGNLNQHYHHYHHHSSSSFHLPHNSCTSIQTQNLSTNDQQPLIVDTHYDHHCNQQHDQQHQQLHSNCHQTTHDQRTMCSKHQLPNSSILAQANSNSSNYGKHSDGCCLDSTTTTSFMATRRGLNLSTANIQTEPADIKCLYCRRDSQMSNTNIVTATKGNSNFIGGRYNEHPPIMGRSSETRDNDESSLYNGQLKSRTLTRTTYKPLNDMYFASSPPGLRDFSNNNEV